MQQIIESLIITLGKVEVRGEENLDMLLGCIQMLKNLLETVKTVQKEVAEDGTEHQQGENV